MSAAYLSCSQCLSRYRVERLEPATCVTKSFHCPSCGNTAGWSQDLSQDYWYTLANSFGLNECKESADLVQEMYAEWSADRGTQSFRQFVEAIRAGSE